MEEILDNIVKLVEKHNISAYSISKNTGISEAGIGKILNKKVKRPHKTTLETILNYLSKLEGNITTTNANSNRDNEINNCISEKKELLERLKQSQKQIDSLIEIISNKLK